MPPSHQAKQQKLDNNFGLLKKFRYCIFNPCSLSQVLKLLFVWRKRGRTCFRTRVSNVISTNFSFLIFHLKIRLQRKKTFSEHDVNDINLFFFKADYCFLQDPISRGSHHKRTF